MDLDKVLAELHAERTRLDAAILSLEKLQQQSPRRGRPPKALAATGTDPAEPKNT